MRKIAAEAGLAQPVRVLLVADVRSPTTWGWVDAIRSAGVVVLGIDGHVWPEHQPAGASSGRKARQRLRSLVGATPGGLKLVGRVRRGAGLTLAPVKGQTRSLLMAVAHCLIGDN